MLTNAELASYGNLTEVSITANSNKPISTADQWNQFSTELSQLLEDGLFGEDPKPGDFVFGEFPWVQAVRAVAFGLEIGEKQHRGHFHLVVEIRHIMQRYSIKKFRDRFKQWLDKNYGSKKGIGNWHVYTKLSPRYDVNYANKNNRWAANDAIERSKARSNGEKVRLQDERMVVQVGKARVLEGNQGIIDSKGRRSYNKT